MNYSVSLFFCARPMNTVAHDLTLYLATIHVAGQSYDLEGKKKLHSTHCKKTIICAKYRKKECK